MYYDASDIVARLRHARSFLLRHLDGMTDEQWAFKPYPECKSALETVAHLISDDRCALDCLRTGAEPDYASYDEPVAGKAEMLARLAQTHAALCEHIEREYAASALDSEVCIYGETRKLGDLSYLAAEDFYHAGQVAYARMATDPRWDYYAAVYGPQT